jgi:thiamine pyrophosphokinase
MKRPTVILADGDFPSHPRPLAVLRAAARIVCCDGAALKLRKAGLEPDRIVGDLDSLPPAFVKAAGAKILRDPGQDDNDLSKAFRYCLAQGWRDLVILGATGLREDHTLGNISLLADFAASAQVRMLTDHGEFQAMLKSGQVPCRKGQSVSIFSLDPATAVTSAGLAYPLRSLKLARWWQATLNHATGSSFGLRFKGGPLLVYLAYSRKAEAEGSGFRKRSQGKRGFRVQERKARSEGSGFRLQESKPGKRVHDKVPKT